MKKGETAEGRVSRVLFPDKAEAVTPEGEKVLVRYALPGQEISFRVTKKRKERMEGVLLDVLEPSPEEIPADCSRASACGGCLYRTLPYEAQLALKDGQMRTLLGEYAEYYEGILPSPEVNAYRNKVELTFGDEVKDGPLMLGMHKKGSFYDIADISDCRIMHKDMKLAAACVLAHFRELGTPFYHRLRHTGVLRHLLLRRSRSEGELLVALVCADPGNGAADLKLDELARKLKALPLEGSLAGFLFMRNNSVADVVQSEHTEIIFGKDEIAEKLLGLTFHITPFSFFQTNSAGAEVLYETVREFVGDTDGKVIYDLYSGTGTIAQILAPVAEQVTGVEIVEEAVEAARVNAAQNGLSNCTFIAGDVLKVVDELEKKPDLLVLDPPRDGIHPKALPKLIGYGCGRIVYVSCKPTSLVRDLPAFLDAGYEIERIRSVDMFPGTGGIETVCLLSNRKPDAKIRIDVDLEEYYRIKDKKQSKES